MENKRKLGDKINQTFFAIVLILFGIILVRFGVKMIVDVAKPEPTHQEYPETMDEFLETSHSLGVPLEMVDSTVNAAFVDGFFNK